MASQAMKVRLKQAEMHVEAAKAAEQQAATKRAQAESEPDKCRMEADKFLGKKQRICVGGVRAVADEGLTGREYTAYATLGM
ncbi:MAG: hypothetical protein SGPRY_012248 [Prymnesium sp.]